MCDSEQIKQRWIGVHHKAEGRDIHGIDCVGIIYAIYADQGINLPGRRLPKSRIDLFIDLLAANFEIAKEPYQFLDILLFRLEGRNELLHCGLYLAADEFIHIIGSQGVIVDTFAAWRPQFRKAYRLRGK